MNDDIIRMAREAGCEIRNGHAYNPYTGSLDQMLRRFDALVRAAEREACAKVCEQLGEDSGYNTGQLWGRGCAAAIRARSTP